MVIHGDEEKEVLRNGGREKEKRQMKWERGKRKKNDR